MKCKRDKTKILKAEIENLKAKIERSTQKYEDGPRIKRYETKPTME